MTIGGDLDFSSRMDSGCDLTLTMFQLGDKNIHQRCSLSDFSQRDPVCSEL